MPYADCAVRLARRLSLMRSNSPCDYPARRRCRVHRIPSRVRDDGQRPSCRERTGRAGRTDLPDGESEIFFAKGLDDPNQIEIAMINRLCERSQTEFRRVGKGALAPCPPSRARRGLWARCRFAHPTQPLPRLRKRVNSLDRFLSRRLICPSRLGKNDCLAG